MARRLTNVSGQDLAIQDLHGIWHLIKADEVVSVDNADAREWPPANWQDVTPNPKTKTKNEEAS